MVTARRGPLREKAEGGSRGAAAALRLMDDPVRVISTTQVGVTGISILTGALGEPVIRSLLGDALPEWARFLVSFLIVAYLSVVLGELVPKALTLDRSERLAAIKPFFDSARQAWESQGRKGSPKLVTIAYYTFGGVDQGRANIRDYNLALGADHAEIH